MAWLNGHCVGLANDTLAFVRGRPGRSVTSAPHKCFSVRMFREGFRPWWEKGIENKQVLFLYQRFEPLCQRQGVSWEKNSCKITSFFNSKSLLFYNHVNKNIYSSISGRIAPAENDVIPGVSFFFLSPPLFYFSGSVGVLFVSPKGRWQPSEGGETPSMKTQIACVGKSDSEANAKRKLLPYRTAHC